MAVSFLNTHLTAGLWSDGRAVLVERGEVRAGRTQLFLRDQHLANLSPPLVGGREGRKGGERGRGGREGEREGREGGREGVEGG